MKQRFFNKIPLEIDKDSAETSVLAIFCNGEETNQFINYRGVPIAAILRLGGTSVALYTNHAGNDACTLSLCHDPATAKKVASLNKKLSLVH